MAFSQDILSLDDIMIRHLGEGEKELHVLTYFQRKDSTMAERIKTNDRRPNHGKLLVAAIDFGTTCTGYAYSLTQDYERDPLNIGTKQSWKGSAEIGLQAPTSILFDPGKNFHSFGFEAENKYKDLAFKKQHRDWYFFRHFKMILHHVKNLTRDTDLEATNQKLMKARVVFTKAIKAVIEHLQTTVISTKSY
ncbi:hypothetical protein CHS0354_017157 [Potamilus streckersoni]|uniref:Uncharacterized protein n=1 Tax=Potamilus streckersoni TaxID=2493646 RepID=A0AAE0W759_9BIVA|nr:hypothetical protein CHS0354_017157 [Potamilus streckersoni]